jgi:hypothetical protein
MTMKNLQTRILFRQSQNNVKVKPLHIISITWRVSPHRLHFMFHYIVYTLYNFQIMKGDYTMAKKTI